MSLITICLLTANRNTEFYNSLKSIKQQTYDEIDVIIGDNSDTNVAKKYVKELLPNAHYYHNKKNIGEINNSNKCISMASTEYVCLFHDDDLFDPEYFNEIIKRMEQNKTIDLAFTGRKMVDENDNELAIQQIKSNNNTFVYKAEDILDYMVFGKPINNYKVFINTPGLVFRKSVFEATGGFDPSVDTHCDTDLLLKILLCSRKVLFINKSLYISKIWYGLSGRTKSSERGNVFFAEKGVLENFIRFSKSKKKPKYYKNSQMILEKFSLDSIAINGPFSWISLRFKGKYIEKAKAMLKTARAIVTLNKKVLLYPKFYFIFTVNLLLPKFVRTLAHKLVIKHYLTKK